MTCKTKQFLGIFCRRYTILFVLCGLLLGLSPVLSAKNLSIIDGILTRGTLRMGADAGFVPFMMRSKKGKLIGFDVDLGKLMAREMGVKLEIVNTEWDGILPALLTKKFDILMGAMTITSQRNLKVNFAEPYIVVGQTILMRRQLGTAIKTYAAFNHKRYRVVARLGTTAEQTVKRLLPNARYKGYQTPTAAVLEVINGRADAFVGDQVFNTIFSASKGRGKVIHLENPFTYEPLAWAVRRNDNDILNWMNHFLRQIKNDGRYQKIYNKWFKETRWQARIQDTL